MEKGENMGATFKTIAMEALNLPKDQRLTLAHRILTSVEPVPGQAVAAAWEREIRERIRRYDAGLTKDVSAAQVFAELDEKLRV
jgi:hypothetical protein